MEVMLNKNDFAEVYETLLSTPGMGDTVKVDLRISRKSALLLSQLVHRGLSVKTDDDGFAIPEIMSKETVDDLLGIANDVLEKSGLTELNNKLKKLLSK